MSEEGNRVLLVEDDGELAAMLDRLLVSEGYQVDVALNGHTGLHLALTNRYQAMVIDRGLPGVDGLDLIGRLRRRGVTTPILVLSALGTARDRVHGLDAGAEDYLPKPFDIDELLARLRALLRRHLHHAEALPIGPDTTLDIASRTVFRGDRPLEVLSERECDLLTLLASRPGVVFTRTQLLELVFADAITDTTVDTYVYYLRRKLGRKAISTVRGVGYRLGTV
ncbi:response regulator transcription factor [Kutzneria sp. CA-103260]|uniref:response regulator transcription factor n=1 Tax=Kutzneria sp. CA-103260 TaxID=2802641 RepID=UPI001BED7D6E|nr:response regulator transcription factor [Kutzneria sp. CA-103260]QUQ63990.1 two-component system response regulator [Kutzneria sp. CA-103260]